MATCLTEAVKDVPFIGPSIPGSIPRLLAVSEVCSNPILQRHSWSLSDLTLVKSVGAGAASTVYYALCRRTHMPLALKIYEKSKLSKLNRHQVEREVQIHCKLSHPHILDFYAAFEDDQRIYLLLEFAAGGDLFDEVKKRGGRLSEQEVVMGVLGPYLDALTYLHNLGIIHRDIKPENTVFTKDGSLKVADFGLAINQGMERPVTRLGTLDYMAPEVLRCPDKQLPQDHKDRPDLAYGPEVDSWACGVLAYELLVGRPPFGMSCRDDTMRAICAAAPQIPDWLSPSARSFIMSALTANITARPSITSLRSHPWIVSFLGPPPVQPDYAEAYMGRCSRSTVPVLVHEAQQQQQQYNVHAVSCRMQAQQLEQVHVLARGGGVYAVAQHAEPAVQGGVMPESNSSTQPTLLPLTVAPVQTANDVVRQDMPYMTVPDGYVCGPASSVQLVQQMSQHNGYVVCAPGSLHNLQQQEQQQQQYPCVVAVAPQASTPTAQQLHGRNEEELQAAKAACFYSPPPMPALSHAVHHRDRNGQSLTYNLSTASISATQVVQSAPFEQQQQTNSQASRHADHEASATGLSSARATLNALLSTQLDPQQAQYHQQQQRQQQQQHQDRLLQQVAPVGIHPPANIELLNAFSPHSPHVILPFQHTNQPTHPHYQQQQHQYMQATAVVVNQSLNQPISQEHQTSAGQPSVNLSTLSAQTLATLLLDPQAAAQQAGNGSQPYGNVQQFGNAAVQDSGSAFPGASGLRVDTGRLPSNHFGSIRAVTASQQPVYLTQHTQHQQQMTLPLSRTQSSALEHVQGSLHQSVLLERHLRAASGNVRVHQPASAHAVQPLPSTGNPFGNSLQCMQLYSSLHHSDLQRANSAIYPGNHSLFVSPAHHAQRNLQHISVVQPQAATAYLVPTSQSTVMVGSDRPREMHYWRTDGVGWGQDPLAALLSMGNAVTTPPAPQHAMHGVPMNSAGVLPHAHAHAQQHGQAGHAAPVQCYTPQPVSAALANLFLDSPTSSSHPQSQFQSASDGTSSQAVTAAAAAQQPAQHSPFDIPVSLQNANQDAFTFSTSPFYVPPNAEQQQVVQTSYHHQVATTQTSIPGHCRAAHTFLDSSAQPARLDAESLSFGQQLTTPLSSSGYQQQFVPVDQPSQATQDYRLHASHAGQQPSHTAAAAESYCAQRLHSCTEQVQVLEGSFRQFPQSGAQNQQQQLSAHSPEGQPVYIDLRDSIPQSQQAVQTEPASSLQHQQQSAAVKAAAKRRTPDISLEEVLLELLSGESENASPQAQHSVQQRQPSCGQYAGLVQPHSTGSIPADHHGNAGEWLLSSARSEDPRLLEVLSLQLQQQQQHQAPDQAHASQQQQVVCRHDGNAAVQAASGAASGDQRMHVVPRHRARHHQMFKSGAWDELIKHKGAKELIGRSGGPISDETAQTLLQQQQQQIAAALQRPGSSNLPVTPEILKLRSCHNRSQSGYIPSVSDLLEDQDPRSYGRSLSFQSAPDQHRNTSGVIVEQPVFTMGATRSPAGQHGYAAGRSGGAAPDSARKDRGSRLHQGSGAPLQAPLSARGFCNSAQQPSSTGNVSGPQHMSPSTLPQLRSSAVDLNRALSANLDINIPKYRSFKKPAIQLAELVESGPQVVNVPDSGTTSSINSRSPPASRAYSSQDALLRSMCNNLPSTQETV